MAIQLSSDDLLLFPSTRRSDYQKSARYQQESTFTDIINNICTYNSGTFIITKPYESTNPIYLYYDTDKPFEFCIKGYRFRLKKLNVISGDTTFDSALNIYAYIDLDDMTVSESTDDHRVELKGRDTDGYYTGLKFTDDPQAIPSGSYSIQLFSRPVADNVNYPWERNVYEKSLYRFAIWGVQQDIDGGIIKY